MRLAEPAKPGIYFLSLDADSRAAVAAAAPTGFLTPLADLSRQRRRGLPLRLDEDVIRRPGSVFRRQVRAAGSADSDPRRITGAMADGALLPVHARWATAEPAGRDPSPPWLLRSAWAEIETNTMVAPFGISLEGEPLLHFSPRQDVALWSLSP